jgi:hypothetical protein
MKLCCVSKASKFHGIVVPQGCAMKKKATKMLILHFAEAGILAGR